MPARAVTRVPVVVPDLGIRDGGVSVSLWLVPRGAAVVVGDRIVELVAGGATIDIETPVTGRLVAQHADEDEVVSVGRILAEFEVAQ